MPNPIAGRDRYDHGYLTDDLTYERPLSSPYYPLYCKISQVIQHHRVNSVLEVGCGSGVLAEMLLDAGISYSGFDFSPVGVQKAQKRNPQAKHFVANACDPSAYLVPYEGIVCCEVLEHIEGDLQAVELWRSGTICVCSVPNFDYETHVRFFESEADVIRRYQALLEITRIERVGKSARANLSWLGYLQRLRWARNEPRRILGMLGINAFEWYGGWFVFTARRR